MCTLTGGDTGEAHGAVAIADRRGFVQRRESGFEWIVDRDQGDVGMSGEAYEFGFAMIVEGAEITHQKDQAAGLGNAPEPRHGVPERAIDPVRCCGGANLWGLFTKQLYPLNSCRFAAPGR